MLWVCGQYQNLISFSAGIVFLPTQSDVCIRQIAPCNNKTLGVSGEETFISLKLEYLGTNPQSPIFQASRFNHCTRGPALHITIRQRMLQTGRSVLIHCEICIKKKKEKKKSQINL